MDSVIFARDVVEVVNAIPEGMVMSYGDVAALVGHPSHARQVGKILGSIGFDSLVPCHRVVTAEGRTAPHWPDQIRKLKTEGVAFTKTNLVDMKLHRWQPEFDSF